MITAEEGHPRGRGRTASSSAPTSGRVIVSEEDLQARIAELGARITADYAGRPPLLVGVLKGAFMFMSDLSRAIDLPWRWTSWPCPPTAAPPGPRAWSAS